jgi:hypothetical protein
LFVNLTADAVAGRVDKIFSKPGIYNMIPGRLIDRTAFDAGPDRLDRPGLGLPDY